MNVNKKWAKRLLTATLAGSMVLGSSVTSFAWTTSKIENEK